MRMVCGLRSVADAQPSVPKGPCGPSIRKHAEHLLSSPSNGEHWLYTPNIWKNITEGLLVAVSPASSSTSNAHPVASG